MNPWRFRYAWLELSDHLIHIAPGSTERIPVSRDAVLAALEAEGNPYGAAIVGSVPVEDDGCFVPEAVDALLVRCHRELQRLALELQQGPRTRDRLIPLIARLRRDGRRIRIVDVGCGIGYVLRWLAARGGLGDAVELVGCDFNAALIAEARRLAQAERLDVTFLAQDAFTLDVPADIYLSSGVLHHIPLDALPAFFAAQERAGARAWLHADFQASPLAAPGSWVFHRARMREPLAVHDGILSAVRAHPTDGLLAAARAGANGARVEQLGGPVFSWLPMARAMHTIAMERE
ncbi:MAG: class I SAM-dependent methyltransferase [Alphaproteobacteria bacterium]|nr:class I SAM-dependent methyltransferase [Alphaproteobacteria bacterium]